MSVVNLPYLNSPTVPLSCTDVSANVALPQKGAHIRAVNLGLNPAWCSSGVGSGTTATASTGNGVAVAPGAVETFRMSPTDTYVAGICAAGKTTTMSFSVVIGA